MKFENLRKGLIYKIFYYNIYIHFYFNSFT